MNELGSFNPRQFSATSPFNQDTGLGWQYIRIINNSPYLLRVALGNQGAVTVPEMWLEDIQLTQSYNGKVTITPIVNIAPANVNSSLSSLVSLNVFQPGELSAPRAQPLGTPGGIGKAGQTVDAVLEAFPSVPCNIAQQNTYALTPAGLNVSGVSAQNPGYLVLGYLNCDNGRLTYKDTRGNKEVAYFQGQNVTVPGSTTGNKQEFSLSGNFLTALLFFGIPAGITITNIELKRLADPAANYVFWPNFTNITTTTTISLVSTWGPDGFTNFEVSGGISIRLTMNNTAGGAQSFSFNAYGYQFAYDEVDVAFSYQDWQNNIYDLGTGRVGQNVTLPLNFLIPIPITNPAQTNFGNILIQVLSFNIFYNTNYTFDVFIPCFVTQLAE